MNALIVGATSAIAEAVCRRLAERHDALFLVGRNRERLEQIASDLRVRGAPRVEVFACDLTDETKHEIFLETAERSLGALDLLLVAHGAIGDAGACDRDFALVRRQFETNFLSAASVLTRVGNRFAERGRGTLVVLSSVAGDRVRPGNYVYGSTKAALTAFTSGLRGRLGKRGVHVLTVKPGFVDTPMTAHMPKNFLWATPEQVARGIVSAIDHKRAIAYVPGFWWALMTVIRALPESWFQRIFSAPLPSPLREPQN